MVARDYVMVKKNKQTEHVQIYSILFVSSLPLAEGLGLAFSSFWTVNMNR